MYESRVKPNKYVIEKSNSNKLFRVDVFTEESKVELSSRHYVYGNDIDAESAKEFIAERYCGDWWFEVTEEKI